MLRAEGITKPGTHLVGSKNIAIEILSNKPYMETNPSTVQVAVSTWIRALRGRIWRIHLRLRSSCKATQIPILFPRLGLRAIPIDGEGLILDEILLMVLTEETFALSLLR